LYIPGADKVHGTYDDRMEVVPNGDIVKLKPFQRLHVRASIPCFDEDVYQFDFLCVLKYDHDPRKIKKGVEYLLTEDVNSRCYVRKETNAAKYNSDMYRYRAIALSIVYITSCVLVCLIVLNFCIILLFVIV
jgi:hypothetical protein